MEEKYYTIYEVADILGLHHKTIRGFISDGKLNAIKIGKQWRITKADLDNFMGKENLSKSEEVQDNIQFHVDGKDLEVTGEKKDVDANFSRISISTVIDIKSMDKENFERISNTLLAVMNSKEEMFEHCTIHMKYEEQANQCKILLWGNAEYIKEIISMVTVLTEEKK